MSRTFEYYIGPNHPGIAGNYSIFLEAEGDTILHAEPDFGYLHRAFEKLMEYSLYIKNIAIVPRICVADPDINEYCYNDAIETIAGVEVPERAKYIRTLMLELSRIAAHLFNFGGASGTTGLYTLSQWSIGDRDYILDLFEELTGGRVYHIYMYPGGVRRDLPEGFEEKVLKIMDYIEKRLELYDDVMFQNKIFIKRAKGIGIVPQDKVIEWGATGPVARGSGLAFDVRKDQPYAVYDKLDFDVITEKDCDVYARMMVRRREVDESIKMVRQIVNDMPKGPYKNQWYNPFKFFLPKGSAYSKIESSKGEYGYYFVSNGSDKPYRVQVRGASYPHAITVFKEITKGARIEDLALIIQSIDACAPEVDR